MHHDLPIEFDPTRAALLDRWREANLLWPDAGVTFQQAEHVEWDGLARRLHGWPETGPAPSAAEQETLVHPAHRDAWRATWSRLLAMTGPGALALTYRLAQADRAAWLSVRWVAMRQGDGRMGVFGRVWRQDGPGEARPRDGDIDSVHLELAVELAQLGLLQEDLASKRVRANAAARRIYGLPSDGEVQVSDFAPRMSADENSRINELRAELQAGAPTPTERPYQIEHPTLGPRWVLVRRRLRVRPDDGQLEMFGAVLDVTDTAERQRRALDAEAQREQAAAVAAERMGLLAAVSHEVRSPLNAILAAVEQLSAKVPADDPDQRLWLGVLREAGDHLHSLAEDLLRGARDERRQQEGAPVEPVQLPRLLRQTLRWLAADATRAGIELRLMPGLGGLTAHVPRRALRQVLLNLLSNAVKYGRRGGTVRVSASLESAGRVCVRVEDDGLGMNADQQRRLFRPFDRAGREGSGIEGFGLGMTIVHELVRSMQGDIDVSSAPGQGTCISLSLPGAEDAIDAASETQAMPLQPLAAPRAPLPPAAAPGPAGRVSANPGAVRVLAVDDDPLTPTLLHAQFHAIGGVDFAWAPDLLQALAAVRCEDPPDLVMLDLHLGAQRGEEVLVALRSAGYTGPVVAFTGEADPALWPALREAGFADVWGKPLSAAALRSGLARVLGEG